MQDIRAPYYGELGRLSFSPGWARPEPSMWPSPKPKFKTAGWRYAAAKAARDPAAGGAAGRGGRGGANTLRGPPPPGATVSPGSPTIASPYQMGRGGERARPHRHTAAALRLVVEAKPGTYTVVDGARIDMAPGD